MGICTDQGPNMLAKVKGLSNRLKADYPHLYLAHDYGHKYNLIGKEASQSFPKEITQLIKDVSKHFSYSSQNISRLEQVQIKNGVPLNKVKTILRYTKVRWFSLLRCAKRIIELWNYLREYFSEQKLQELDYFNDKNFLYMNFFCVLMGHPNDYCEFSQCEGKSYADIAPKLRESFQSLSRVFYVDAPAITDLNKIFDHYYELSLDEGVVDLEMLKVRLCDEYPHLEVLTNTSLSQEDQDEIFEVVKKFILKTLQEMKKRIPFKDDIIQHSNILRLTEFNKKIWNQFAMKYPNVIPVDLQDSFFRETRNLEGQFNSGDIFKILPQECKSNPVLLWTHEKINAEFKLLAKLAKSLLVIPYSSASVERTFSDFKTIKTKKRNCLCRESLEACLLIFQEFRKDVVIINEDMIQRYNNIWISKETNPLPVTQNQNTYSDLQNNTTLSQDSQETENRKTPSIAPQDLQSFSAFQNEGEVNFMEIEQTKENKI